MNIYVKKKITFKPLYISAFKMLVTNNILNLAF